MSDIRSIPAHAENLYSRFEEAGIPLLLAGGWAVCYHGYSRLTTDVDWVCSREFEERAVKLMEELRFVKTTEGMASRFRRPDQLAFPPIDLIWVDADSFARMNVSVDRTGRNLDIPVVGFEGLLAMKLHALKDDESRKGKDLMDIRFLLEYNPGIISVERLKAMCERFAGPGAYDIVKPN
jgi:hypothetical protein